MQPLVTIVIPVGPRHREVARQAAASCTYQTYGGWRALLVNDSGAPLPPFADERIAIVVGGRAQPGQSKPAVARNIGLAHVATPFVVFLDADDYLLPDALTLLLRGHAGHDRAYTYSQWYSTSDDGTRAQRNHLAYGYQQWRYAHFNLHPITALLPTEAVREVGGFDEQAPGFEDWTLYLRMAMAGYCADGIYQPTFVYRIHLGSQHQDDAANARAIMDQVIATYKGGRQEIPFMACGCGGGAQAAKAAAQRAVAANALPEIAMSKEHTTLEYTGKQQGTITIKAPNKTYRVSAAPSRRYLTTANQSLHQGDVQHLLNSGRFRTVAPAPTYEPPPPPAPRPNAPEPEGEAQVLASDQAAEEDALTEPDPQDPDGAVEPTPARRKRANRSKSNDD